MSMVGMGLQPSLEFAVGLTALLAASAGQKQLPRAARAEVPAWVPRLLLGVLAASSCAFGILHPDAFAAAFGDGIALPETAATLASQF